MKETREQYQARKQAALERRRAWEKRRDERIAKRKAEATEQAFADWAKRAHITPAQARAMNANDLIDRYNNSDDGVDRREILAVEIVRRAKKYAKQDGIQFENLKPDHGFSNPLYVGKAIDIVKMHVRHAMEKRLAEKHEDTISAPEA